MRASCRSRVEFDRFVFAWPDLDVDGSQFSAAELRDAIAGLRDWVELTRPRSPEQLWEADFDDGLTEEEWTALYGQVV